MAANDSRIFDDNLIIDYLLARLPEQEHERLDEMSVANDDFADRLLAVETDLVDAYVRGELSGDVLRQFESSYLASPIRRERVAIARAFGSTAQKQVKQATSLNKKLASDDSSKRVFVRRWSGLRWAAAVAAMILLAAALWLGFENRRLQNQLQQASSEREELKAREDELRTQIENNQQASAEKQKELESIREQLAALENEKSASGKPSPSGTPNIVSLLLAPPTRGTGDVPNVSIPRDAEYLALRLGLESDRFEYYEADLNSADQKTVWKSGSLKPRPSSRKSILVNVPARLLTTHQYSLKLYGVPSGGNPEVITSYTFRVNKQP